MMKTRRVNTNTNIRNIIRDNIHPVTKKWAWLNVIKRAWLQVVRKMDLWRMILSIYNYLKMVQRNCMSKLNIRPLLTLTLLHLQNKY